METKASAYTRKLKNKQYSVPSSPLKTMWAKRRKTWWCKAENTIAEKIGKNMAQPCFFGFGPLLFLSPLARHVFSVFWPTYFRAFFSSAREQLPIDLGMHDEYSYIIFYFRLHSYFKPADCLIPVPNTNTRLQHLRQHRRQHLLPHRSLAHVHLI